MIHLFFMLFSMAATAATGVHLQVGDVLPGLSGETASGKPVELPAAGVGDNRVLVFSFAKAASGDSRAWSEHLAKDPNADGPVVTYRVILLESVPRLVRGMAVAGIKSGVPQAQWERTVLSYKEEGPWKTRLGVSSDKHAYAVLLDGAGKVCWMSTGPFTDSEYGQLKTAISQLPKSH